MKPACVAGWILLCATVATAPARAQAINIDLGDPATPAPTDSYRAAGLPGVWNKLDALTSGFDYSLLDRWGQLTGATVSQIGGTEILDATLGAPGDPSGNDAVLLKDALISHTPIENCLFFDGLENGTYEVLTYAWMPTFPTVLNKVRVDFTPTEFLVGGAWAQGHVEGLSYALHRVNVTTGFLGTHSGVPDGGDLQIGAALNGVQIRRLEPEPPLFADSLQLNWLSSMGANRYDVVGGDLSLLRGSEGDFTVATDECLADNATETSSPHGPDPLPGQGRWYVVRGVAGFTPITYNAPGTSQLGDRDGEINAAGPACL